MVTSESTTVCVNYYSFPYQDDKNKQNELSHFWTVQMTPIKLLVPHIMAIVLYRIAIYIVLSGIDVSLLPLAQGLSQMKNRAMEASP